jgi:hypothetical protein
MDSTVWRTSKKYELFHPLEDSGTTSAGNADGKEGSALNLDPPFNSNARHNLLFPDPPGRASPAQTMAFKASKPNR